MGDTAEFEKLHTLEARLAAALDRIAMGLGEAPASAPLDDPGFTSAALEDALIRAHSAEARVAALEARLSQPAPDPAPSRDSVALLARIDDLEMRLGSLRAEIRDLQSLNDRLIETNAALRAEPAGHPEALNMSLRVELDALRGLRASEAAELDRILADLDCAAAGESTDA